MLYFISILKGCIYTDPGHSVIHSNIEHVPEYTPDDCITALLLDMFNAQIRLSSPYKSTKKPCYKGSSKYTII